MQFLCSRDEFGMVLTSVSPFLSAADKIVDFSMSRILKGQSPAQDLKRRQFRRLCAWRSDPWHVAQMLLISEIDRHLLPTFSWRWPTILIGLYHICNNSFLLRLLVYVCGLGLYPYRLSDYIHNRQESNCARSLKQKSSLSLFKVLHPPPAILRELAAVGAEPRVSLHDKLHS
jgi:hypothetical protein